MKFRLIPHEEEIWEVDYPAIGENNWAYCGKVKVLFTRGGRYTVYTCKILEPEKYPNHPAKNSSCHPEPWSIRIRKDFFIKKL